MKIGLYIPCFNAQAYIDKVLEAVLNQSVKPEDILIIDDASTDKTPEIVCEYPVRVIRHGTNKGLAAARNTALSALNTEYIASLDADCAADPDWLRRLLDNFSSEDIAGAGGKLKEAYDKDVCDQWRSVHMPQYWPDTMKDPEFLFGSNTMFRRKALLEIGGYDEKFRNNYEDVDVCRRLKAKGWKIVYEPKALVRHLKQDTAASLLDTYWKWRLPYYNEELFYETKDRFIFKIKDNIGLANRYLQEDIGAARWDIIYIDFLLAFDHCLRDFSSYIKHKYAQKSAPSIACAWLSLFDLNFFYCFDKGKKSLATLLPKENIMTQNLFALILIVGRTILDRFKTRDFLITLWRDILYCFSSSKDEQLSEQLVRLIERRSDWDDFLKKEHKHLSDGFLSSMNREFNAWFNNLTHDKPEIIFKIRDSARKLHAQTRRQC